MSTNVIEITDNDFAVQVTKSTMPVLIDFWAPWCNPCLAIKPNVDKIAEEYQGKVKVGKINIDESTKVASELGIRQIPTLVLFKDGQPIDQTTGIVSKEKIAEFIDKHISA